MFFSDEVNTGPAIQDTIVQLNGEFTNRIEQLKEENPYDALDLDNAALPPPCPTGGMFWRSMPSVSRLIASIQAMY